MYCNSCGVAIPPKEEETAGTCYNCGETLWPQLHLVRDKQGEPREITEEEPVPHDFGLDVADELAAEHSEYLQASAATPLFTTGPEIDAAKDRHPSTPQTQGPFVHVQAWTGTKWEDVWVQAPNVTQARTIVYKSEIEPEPLDREGWGTGQAWWKNRARSVREVGKASNLPSQVSRFLNTGSVYEPNPSYVAPPA